jgi:acetyltransferase-like isoleucine patch superfamily enzyme
MSKRLLIVGTGGYAKDVGLIARRIDPHGAIWNPISYVAASRSELGSELLFGRVDYCDEEILSGSVAADAIIALGDPQPRLRVAARYLKVPTLSFPNVIDPSVDIDWNLIRIGVGNVFQKNVVMTFGNSIGDFNMFNKGSILGHDLKLGSFNTISPSACVLGHLGDACLIGAGACVLTGVNVADCTTLGAGALLRDDVQDKGLVLVGIPAKKLR